MPPLPPLKPAEYMRYAREIEAASSGQAARLVVLSTFTAELLRPFLIVEGERLDCPLRPKFGPFGQLEQPILNPSSDLWQPAADVIWIALRLEDVDRHLVHDRASIGVDATRQRLTSVVDRLVSLARAARDHYGAALLISNLVPDARHDFDLFDANDEHGFVHLLADANRRLARELATLPGAYVFDYAGVVARCGAQHWTDPKLWYLARAGGSSENMVALASRLVRSMRAILHTPAKCLVLDLDNTLWGGVLGDDGPGGIKLGDDYPGNVFKDFQAALLGLRQRGFLLAIASKNDEATVLSALATHPEMLLKPEHFACIRANWQAKPANLREIAGELNIGLDSLVFIDDNPVERAAVRAELPTVHVVDLPNDPLGYLAALAEVSRLDRPRTLAEDRGRAAMYRSESLRRQDAASAASLPEFLSSLGMVAQVGRADTPHLERIHQLIQKTNQFNLTTRRHSIDHLRRLAGSSQAAVAWLRLHDRYGDMGLVCVGILERLDENVWSIDTLLMSCRVMGRQVEDAFLSYLAEIARQAGAKQLQGIYCPTVKNTPVSNFYSQHGFVRLGGEAEVRYAAELGPTAFSWPAVIARGGSAGETLDQSRHTP